MLPALALAFHPQVGDLEVALGDAVLLAAEDEDEVPALALVQAMWQTSDGAPPRWPAALPLSQTHCRPDTPLSPCAKRSRQRGSPKPGWRLAGLPHPLLSESLCTLSVVPPALPAGCKEVQVRLLARGEETVLGDAASDSEVFLTPQLETR